MGNHNESHKKSKPLSNSFYVKLYIILGIALIIFAVYNINQGASFGSIFNQKLVEAKEAARPAQLQLVIIDNKDCEDCFNISSTIDSLKKANVNITKEVNLDLTSKKAIKLIEEYSIDKVPAFLLSGEVKKLNINNLEERGNNVLVFDSPGFPYTDTSSGEIMGKVSAIILKDTTCDNCIDLNKVLDILKRSGVKIVSEEIIERGSDDGKEFINKYSDRKSTRLNSSHTDISRMPSSA